MKKYFDLFFTMLKIGLFTFGGGYSMIPILENEFVEKKKLIQNEEFINMVSIAESTPGPSAINFATYLGYKFGGFLGAFICTLGVCIPSFVIIFLISLFFNQFLSIAWVAAAFKGVQVCVIYLILSAGIKMFINLPKTIFNILILILTIVCMVCFSLFSVGFSTIFYILISGGLGLLLFSINHIKNKNKSEDKS